MTSCTNGLRRSLIIRAICVIFAVIGFITVIMKLQYIKGMFSNFNTFVSKTQNYKITERPNFNALVTNKPQNNAVVSKPQSNALVKPQNNVVVNKLQNYKTTKRPNTKAADCPIPKWHLNNKNLQAAPWYSLYSSHLQKVNLSLASKARREISCSRWWHPTPHKTYDELPDRGLVWKPNIKPPNYKRPNCTFGQKLVPKTTCAKKMEPLFKRLEEIGALYFPRDGSEVGVVRGSSYLTSDGDMDLFVDMPQEILQKALVNALSPKPKLVGRDVGRGVHWQIKGCPIVHIHFSDWTGVERGEQATHMDTCTCMLNSVPITCHKEGISRLYTEYGPSWRVPLHSKHLDCPVTTYTFKWNSVKKLKSMVSPSGLIEEKNVRALDRTIQYSKEEMKLILAHLNVIQARIAAKITYKGVKC